MSTRPAAFSETEAAVGVQATHELLSELMSLWVDSCLTLGVTMAGCGMPVVCKLWWGGTMCGGNLEDRRLCKSSEWTQVK